MFCSVQHAAGSFTRICLRRHCVQSLNQICLFSYLCFHASGFSYRCNNQPETETQTCPFFSLNKTKHTDGCGDGSYRSPQESKKLHWGSLIILEKTRQLFLKNSHLSKAILNSRTGRRSVIQNPWSEYEAKTTLKKKKGISQHVLRYQRYWMMMPEILLWECVEKKLPPHQQQSGLQVLLLLLPYDEK